MAIDQRRLVWLDMEMTGLNPDSDTILELAMVVTDADLNVLAESPSWAVHQSAAVLAAMDEWNTKTHGASGLIARVSASMLDMQAVEAAAIDFLKDWVGKGASPMCGNSICQDRRFMARYMPGLIDWFHYRNLDVSTLKELCRRWRPELMVQVQKTSAHTALADIHESIEELRFYREHFIRAQAITQEEESTHVYKKVLKIAFRRLSKELGVTEDFITNIYDEKNSWSFISKLAQFLEGVFTIMLVKVLNEPAIFGLISNLPQSTRINFCHELEFVSKEQKLLFLTIAEIRNDYIHETSNFDVNLTDYFNKLKEGRKKEILKRFQHFSNDKKLTDEEFFKDSQNQIFTVCALEILKCFGSVEGFDVERKHYKFRADQALKLIREKKEGDTYLEDKIRLWNPDSP